MKTIAKYIFALAIFGMANFQSFAQQEKDTTMIVNGLCNMCKMTIESAAEINGVSMASWSPETKVLQLRYIPSEVKLEEVNKAINESGYDTEFSTASEEAYQSLHKCCHYRDPKVIKDHENK